MGLSDSARNRDSGSAATERVYNVVILPDRVWATSEDDARAVFIKALTEDSGLIRVSEEHEDIYVDDPTPRSDFGI